MGRWYMRAKDEKQQLQVATLPVWPTMKVFGYRSRSAGYAAVRHLPPEAVIQIGKLKRLSKRWVDRRTSGRRLSGPVA